jgi:hypothetical protein
MLRMFVVAVSLVICSVAAAQVLPLADVKAKGGVQLSADDLKQLMPGANVMSVTLAGSTRRWVNKADGTLVGSTDGRGYSGGRTLPASGEGSWRLADNGTYCVTIKWGVMVPENWCRYIFKAGDKYYTFAALEDTARSWEFEISK